MFAIAGMLVVLKSGGVVEHDGRELANASDREIPA